MSNGNQSDIDDILLKKSLQDMFTCDEDEKDKVEKLELLNQLREKIMKKRMKKFKWINAVAAGILIVICVNVFFIPIETYASKNGFIQFIIELKSALNITGGSTSGTIYDLPYTKDIYGCMDRIAFLPYIPTFIPNEYAYRDVEVTDNIMVISFINEPGDKMIRIYQQKADQEAMLVFNIKTSAEYERKTVDLNGNTGILFESEKNKILIWENESTYFKIVCNLEENTIIKIATSMMEAEYNIND